MLVANIILSSHNWAISLTESGTDVDQSQRSSAFAQHVSFKAVALWMFLLLFSQSIHPYTLRLDTKAKPNPSLHAKMVSVSRAPEDNRRGSSRKEFRKEQIPLINDAIKRDHEENKRGAAIVVVVREESSAEEVEKEWKIHSWQSRKSMRIVALLQICN